MKIILRLIQFVIVMILLIVVTNFTLLNFVYIEVDLRPFATEAQASFPLYLLVFLPFLIGLALAWVVVLPGHMLKGQRAARAERETEALERELESVRGELKAAEKKLAGDDPKPLVLPAPGSGRRRLPAMATGGLPIGAEWGAGINSKRVQSAAAQAAANGPVSGPAGAIADRAATGDQTAGAAAASR